MTAKHFFSAFVAALVCLAASAKDYNVKSPDGKTVVRISKNNDLTISITKGGETILVNSPISMTLSDGSLIKAKEKSCGVKYSKINTTVDATVYKKAKVQDVCNQMVLSFARGNLVVRAYDEGVAYRFESKKKGSYQVMSEQADYKFTQDWEGFFPYVKSKATSKEGQFFNSFENVYSRIRISEFDANRLAFLPVTVRAGKYSVCITETNLHSYPGMYMEKGITSTSLGCRHAAYPKKEHQGGHNYLQSLVDEREAYIAKVNGPKNFPWRVFVIAQQEKDLMNSDLAWLLASPAKGDYSWVKPGKVAWDWWNDWNIYGVDFRAGVNNDTYKYYIDFASANGIEYVILDEGWAVSGNADLFDIVPEIDIPMLSSYAQSRNVGLILWAGYKAFDKEMEKVCKHYSELGIKGFKVDFMDRDDQDMVDFYERAAQITAKYKMVVDFHGAFKPIGLQRTYPNVINHEGVYGQENCKWDPDYDQMAYDVTVPYARMVAGPLDYTQGAMINAARGQMRAIWHAPMCQGTRCHQLAEYVIFESPLNMLCDTPINYMREQECVKFMAECPVVWDETVAISGRIAEYSVIARRKGDTWYLAALGNWDARDLTLGLGFLGKGSYVMEEFRDGVNADQSACDYKRLVSDGMTTDSKLNIHLAPGGGWVACFRRK